MRKILQIVAIVHDKLSDNYAQLTSPKIVAVAAPHLIYDRSVQLGMPAKFSIENPGEDLIEV